jgi:type VI secretion system secreted protein Hcp
MKTKLSHRLCALVCALLISGFDASAALNAYFKATGITGDVTRPGLEDFTEVNGYNHELIAPFDPSTGLATGKRQHRPFKIVKEITRSSIDFENTLVQGQTLKNAEIRLYRQNQVGQDINYYTYRFVGVRIVSVRDWMPNNKDPAVVQFPHMQEISFTYETIEWEYVNGGFKATDTWVTR